MSHKRINKIKKNKEEKNWYPLIATLWNNLLLLPELGNLPAQNGPAPLLEDHELEAVKVGVGVPLLALLKVLGPGGSLPLGNDVVGLQALLKSLRLGRVGHGDLEVGQREALEVDGLAGNSGGGSVNQSPVVVNDVDNDGGLAGIGTVVDEGHAANLDEAGEERLQKKRFFLKIK